MITWEVSNKTDYDKKTKIFDLRSIAFFFKSVLLDSILL